MKDLKKKTLTGLGWSSAGNLVGQAMQFVVSIILARLLMPEDFGLMAMVLVFTSLAQVFMNFGFGSALIQDKNAAQEDFSTIFYLNVAIGIVLFIITFLISDLVAQFYETEIISKILRILSVTFIISSFGIIPNIILTKEIDFNKVVKVDITANFLSGLVAIILAYLDYGVYSLVAQSIMASLLRTTFIFFASRWTPSLVFEVASVKKYLNFSSNILFINIISKTLDEMDTILIGKFYPAASLGIFNRAKTLRKYPLQIIGGGINKVMYPSLAKIQDDDERLVKYYSALIHILSFLVIPVMFTLVIIAEPLILLILTEKWIEVVPIFQILCLVGFMISIGGINSNIFLTKGKSRFLLKFETVKRILFSLIILASLRFGLKGMATAIALATTLSFLANLHFPGKLIGFKFYRQLKIISFYLVIAIFSSSVALLYQFRLNEMNLLFQILIPSIQILIFYVFLVYFFKLKGFVLIMENLILPTIKKLELKKS
ncbi:O-antigen/teichoic acid export membrane protein [Gramella sp. Hel_I_59]|uniref:MOP flippase family protein n=1 Tax=Gramella sp. Hel_I_59 TaxID=1249978 RepID=UPI00114DB3F1|nr:MOP flippase family protein [Gramella sp. Hel_I_59]TQI71951.1 O-antigen/teichoic acid export membrane protein [Gramella sp. Hel_I_59]